MRTFNAVAAEGVCVRQYKDAMNQSQILGLIDKESPFAREFGIRAIFKSAAAVVAQTYKPDAWKIIPQASKKELAQVTRKLREWDGVTPCVFLHGLWIPPAALDSVPNWGAVANKGGTHAFYAVAPLVESLALTRESAADFSESLDRKSKDADTLLFIATFPIKR